MYKGHFAKGTYISPSQHWAMFSLNDKASFWLTEDVINLFSLSSHFLTSQDLKLMHLYNVDILNINHFLKVHLQLASIYAEF